MFTRITCLDSEMLMVSCFSVCFIISLNMNICFFFRTGSKLGISPLMLAAMNGHVPAVKLLLDMGSDINAQIETNRNTALTLACFQGRAEVVSLLLDRKANVEHRAKVEAFRFIFLLSMGVDLFLNGCLNYFWILHI